MDAGTNVEWRRSKSFFQGGTPALPIISATIRNLKALNKTFLIHTLDARETQVPPEKRNLRFLGAREGAVSPRFHPIP